MNPKIIWGGIKEELRRVVPPEEVNLWLRNAKLVELTDVAACIQVPDEITCEYVTQNYGKPIEQVLQSATGSFPKVTFKVNPELTLPVQGELFEFPEAKAAIERPVLVDKAQQSQKLAYGSLNLSYSFDSFVVGAHNDYAVAAAQGVVETPGGRYNPLLIAGESGLGKTHLMHAIAAGILEKRPKTRIVLVNSEEFINEFIQAIKDNSLDHFRKRYRHADVLMIDDIHNLAGKDRSMDEFFHTFNRLHDTHKQIILTCDRLPSEIKGLEKRLISRFEWGLTTTLTPPDLETREAILRKMVLHMQGAPRLPDEVFRFVAAKIKSNVRRLRGAILQVVTHATLNKERLLTPQIVADEILTDVIHQETKETLNAHRIQEVVASHYTVRHQELLGKGRTALVAEARMMAMFLCRELTRMTYQDIGTAFGNRNHATALHACRRIEELLRAEEKVRRDHQILLNTLRR